MTTYTVPRARDARSEAARQMRATAGKAQASHPTMTVHGHLRDAARAHERGLHEGAVRHLTAAIHELTPLNLMRHAFTDDETHIAAKQHMDEITRHILVVKDTQDSEARAHDRAAAARAMNAPNRTSAGPSDRTAEGPSAPLTEGTRGLPARSINKAGAQSLGGNLLSWAEIFDAIELSAQTARLAVTPAPYGKPGGPGLYGVKGNKHSDYFEQVVKALMEKRGLDKGRASAIAWGALRKWSRGGGKVHPEVRAAAAGALAQEGVARAAAHAHANPVASAINLVGPKGYVHGWKFVGVPAGFAAGLKPGSQDHVRAIWELGDLAARNTMDGRPSSDTLGNSLHNLARAVERRDMKAARIHLESARWADEHEASSAYKPDLDDIDKQLGQVPAGALGWMPRSHGESPVRYVSRTQTPFDPTAGATFVPKFGESGGYTIQAANWNGVFSDIELAAGGPQWENEGRNPKGQPGGGQFAKGGGSGQQGKAGHHSPGGQHRHLTPQQRAAAKTRLLRTAKDDRSKARALLAQIRFLQSQYVSTGTGRSASSTPAKTGAGALSAAQAKGATVGGSAVSSSSRAASSASSAASSASQAARRNATIHGRIVALRAQVQTLLAAAKAADAQAAKL